MQNMLIVNEDNSHFFGSRSAEAMTREGLHAFVDQYADTAVTHLFLCPNAMRASFRSTTRDAIWDPVDGAEPQGRWPQNAKLLHERGLDPYAVWIERSREHGLSPWLSMRMNDIHSVNEPDNFMHSTFWREHPEYWREPRGDASPWQNRAMNYVHEEVRQHQMAFVRELLTRYDMDGLELDWMRFGYHLTPGKALEQRDVLTDFVRHVRELTREWSERRGHPVRLSVRVPAHPDAARGLGMDGVRWGREGLIDLLTPCPFWASSDFDIPVELWRERLGDAAATVILAPGIEHNSRPWPGAQAVANNLASLYGFAASVRHRSADAIYLFNWMDSQTRPVASAQYRELLEKGLGSDVVLSEERRHLVCYRDTVPPGFPNDVALPLEIRTGGSFRIHVGPAPAAGQVFLILGVDRAQDLEDVNVHVTLNGSDLIPGTVSRDSAGMGGGAKAALSFALPVTALKDGYNTIRVQPSGADDSPRAVWAEMRIHPAQK